MASILSSHLNCKAAGCPRNIKDLQLCLAPLCDHVVKSLVGGFAPRHIKPTDSLRGMEESQFKGHPCSTTPGWRLGLTRGRPCSCQLHLMFQLMVQCAWMDSATAPTSHHHHNCAHPFQGRCCGIPMALQLAWLTPFGAMTCTSKGPGKQRWMRRTAPLSYRLPLARLTLEGAPMRCSYSWYAGSKLLTNSSLAWALMPAKSQEQAQQRQASLQHVICSALLAQRPEAAAKRYMLQVVISTYSRCACVSVCAAYLAPGPNAKLAHEVAFCLPQWVEQEQVLDALVLAHTAKHTRGRSASLARYRPWSSAVGDLDQGYACQLAA